MAESKKRETEPVLEPAAEEKTEVKSAVYTVQEIIDASDALFDQPKEVVVVALSNAKSGKLTVDEAKNLIEEFLKQEVK